MFLVFNKEKIYAYLVSILTVCLLFFIASTNTPKDVQTGTKAETSNSVETNSNANSSNDEVKTNTNPESNSEKDNNKKEQSINEEQKEQECSLVPNDETNSVDTSGNMN
ncbi:MAG: hypothetical protein IJH76_01765 [Clostridia bacterium]|nr:hypothetical protein [Clostridia bacterium]